MMVKPKYDIVFVVLVYRNTEDLKEFFLHNHLQNTHTVVVNSYYDDISEKVFLQIAEENGASFLSVPNKGYGAGNNQGCEYAMEHFEFDYLVISNADIMIEKLGKDVLQKHGNAIIAPRIVNLRGRNQNPSAPFCPSRVYEYIRRYVYAGGHRYLIWGVFVFSRFTKILFYILHLLGRQRIFSAHGAFFIMPHKVLRLLYPLYNEEMFLFNEEEYLGRLCRQKGVPTIYEPAIVVRHKEDGSMRLASVNEFEMMRQSYLIYFDKWMK